MLSSRSKYLLVNNMQYIIRRYTLIHTTLTDVLRRKQLVALLLALGLAGEAVRVTMTTTVRERFTGFRLRVEEPPLLAALARSGDWWQLAHCGNQ